MKSGYINASNQKVAVKLFRKDSSATNVLAEPFVYAEMSGHRSFSYFFGFLDGNSCIMLEQIECALNLGTTLSNENSLK